MAHPPHAAPTRRGELDLPSFQAFSDERSYDRDLGCYVKPERSLVPDAPRRPRGEWKKPVTQPYHGAAFWITDRLTGQKLVKINAPDLQAAHAMAARFAVANGFSKEDCYALPAA